MTGAVAGLSQDRDGNVTIKFHSKTEALKMLASHLKLDSALTRTALEGPNGGPVQMAALIATMTPEEAQQAYREMIKA